MKTRQEHRHTVGVLCRVYRERDRPPPPQASQVGTNRRTAGLGASAHRASQGSSYMPPCLQGISHFQVLMMIQWFLKGVWVHRVSGHVSYQL